MEEVRKGFLYTIGVTLGMMAVTTTISALSFVTFGRTISKFKKGFEDSMKPSEKSETTESC